MMAAQWSERGGESGRQRTVAARDGAEAHGPGFCELQFCLRLEWKQIGFCECILVGQTGARQGLLSTVLPIDFI